ncbi:MAG TPA: DUF2891 family protein [Puia sp.]|uniref:DUF2891 family protein n=1 Tax=Puia sp. TaxID=2045100 RepID=UPI002C4905E7|nr:DUF2891 family protein [Puia sp.]HVU93609.1 DUF2891 family protein [Puia sp.]
MYGRGNKILVAGLILLCAFRFPQQQAGGGLDIVRVEGGLISGSVNSTGNIHVFKGIPFAAPPVGGLRWKAPQPVRSWTGVKSCVAFGPSPMQASPAPFSMWSEEFLIPKEPISEDCLYLNVWTGAEGPAEKRPVLVWIYGGGFVSGGSAVPIYDGEAMAKKGIVFVSINYRVGIFGFFAHPGLTKESGRRASGNYGLMDQVAALKWVQKNIAAFGGDAGNVTIAGQSAGSMSVNALVASPLARGLFKRAIGESGASFTGGNASLANAEGEGMKVMASLKAASLSDLRALSADQLLKSSSELRGPIIDGYVLPDAIDHIFKSGKENRVDLLTGWNQDEGLVFGPMKNAEEFRKDAHRQYGADADAFLKYYPAATEAEATASQLDLSRDMIFGVQNYEWANIQSGQGSRVYVYRFARKPPATGEYVKYGAFHTAEVPYAYDNLSFVNRPWEQVDRALAAEMSAYWANFAATGDPNGTGLPAWDRYTMTDKRIMVLDKVSASRSLPDADALDLLYKLLLPGAGAQASQQYELKDGKYRLTMEGAAHFADLPLRCMQREFPYKTGVAFPDSTLAVKPREYHPAFYGCFDWHSSVHGHWMLVRLLKLFPGMPRAAEIRQRLTENLSAEHIAGEMKIFAMKDNLSFERTYGWAWLLQLENELLRWDDPLGRELAANVAPLAHQLSGMFVSYLPKMNYPVRVGEHTNLAFALRLAWDYASFVHDAALIRVIRETAMRMYSKDMNYPLSWEPGGNDFLSPGLEEADLMWRLMPDTAYQRWVRRFLPVLADPHFNLEPGRVTDRSDGKLVHLDGLNLSRAWDLYGIARHLPANRAHLYALANQHLTEALPHVASGDYMGEHWLASFAVYTMTEQ